MADSNDDVNVKVGVTADANAGLNTVVNQLKAAVDQMTAKLGSLSSASASTSEKIKEHNNATAASFKSLQSKVTEAHGTLIAGFSKLNAAMAAVSAALAGGAAYHEAISKTMEFNSSVMKLAKTMGINSDEATTMAVALHNVGADVGTYESSFRKFEMQVKRNSAGLRAMGVDVDAMNNGTKSSMEVFNDAIKIVGKYEQGHHQLQAAMKILGSRGAKDIQSMLRAVNQDMKAMEEEQRSLGLTVTEEGMKMQVAYKQSVAGVDLVFTAVGKVIAETIMPRLTAMAEWFKSKGPAAVQVMREVMSTFGDVMSAFGEIFSAVWDVIKTLFSGWSDMFAQAMGTGSPAMTGMELFRNMLKVVGIAVQILAAVIKEALEFIKMYIDGIVGVLMGFARVAEAAFTFGPGWWGRVQAAWAAGTQKIKDDFAKHTNEMVRIAAEGKKKIDDIALGGPTAANKGTIIPKKTGLHMPEETKKGHEKDDRMSVWREELDKRIEMEIGYFNDSKALEIKFWEEKLALAKAALAKDTDIKSEAYRRDAAVVRQIEKMLFNDRKSAANKQLGEDIKVMEDEAAAAKHNIDEQIRIARQIFDIKSRYYSEDVAKIADANKKIIALEQQKAEMISKLEQQRTAYRLEANMMALQGERDKLTFEVDMGRVSADQRYSQEVAFAQRAYQLTVQSIKETNAIKMANLTAGTVEYQIAQEEMDKQILDATKKTEAEILKIKRDALKEAAKLEMEAIQATQSAAENLLSTLMSQPKNWKQAFLDAAKSVQQAINGLVSKSLMDQLMGPGTDFRKMLSGLFGGLFGSKTTAPGAAGAAAADTAMASLATVTTTTAIPAVEAFVLALNTASAAAGAGSAMEGAGGFGGMLSGLLGGGASAGGGAYGFVGALGGVFAEGTNFVPRDMVAQIHKGEAIIPARDNKPGVLGGFKQTNNITINGPVDTRTMDQIAAQMALAQRRAAGKLG